MSSDNNASNSSGANKFPGFGYLQRMSASYTTAVTGQGSEANTLWRSLKDGTFEFKQLGGAFARTVESYYDVVTEALKGPNYAVRPEWANFKLKKSDNPVTPLTAEVAVDKQPDETLLDYTPFIEVLGTHRIEKPADKSYLVPLMSGDKKAVFIELSSEALAEEPPGQYTCMIYATGRNGSPPLVIVTLIIEP